MEEKRPHQPGDEAETVDEALMRCDGDRKTMISQADRAVLNNEARIGATLDSIDMASESSLCQLIIVERPHRIKAVYTSLVDSFRLSSTLESQLSILDPD